MQDRYLNGEEVLNRLKAECDKYDTLYIAFDFDNTVFDFHKVGDSFEYVESCLVRAKKAGLKLILFTGHDDADKLNKIVSYCSDRGYKPDYVNESPVMPTRKPYYNLLVDDRAGLKESVMYLTNIIDYKLCK